MQRKSYLWSAFLLVPLLTCSCIAAGNVTISEVVTLAKQDCPIQIIGFRLPDTSKDRPRHPSILVQNTTSVAALDVRINDLVRDPRGAGDGTVFGPGDHRESPQNFIGPQEQTEIGLDAFGPYNFAFVAHELESNCLQVAVYVSRVDFADGTIWKQDSRQAQALWQASLTSQSASRCDGSDETLETMNELKAVTWSMSPPHLSTSDTIQSYSVNCPVRTIDGAVTAVCDW